MSLAKGVGLSPLMIERATVIRTALDAVNGDVDRWVESLGYEFHRVKLRYGAYSVLIKTLFGTEIRVKPGLSHNEEIGSIAHEICHDLFHPDCISYRILSRVQIERDEGQAEMFASIVVFPSLKEFETIDQFCRTCRVTKTLAEMRIAFFEKYGW